MKKRLVAAVSLCLVAALLSGGYAAAGREAAPNLPAGQTAMVRVYYPDLATGNQVLLAFEPWLLETNYGEGYHVMQVSQSEIDRLVALGLKVEKDDAWIAPPVLQSLPVEIDSIPSYPCYRTVEETFASAQALTAAHPNLATWTDVGNSWEKSAGLGGYDMMVLKLTNSAIGGDKPKLFVTGAIHAREYATAELVTRFGEYLVNNYGIDADATWILDHHEVHLMLHTNPDGRKKAETGLSWRKNTNQNYCGATSNNRGADLNRNFDFQWDCCGGSSDNPCDQTYHGASPASEPEIQAVQAYMASLFPDQRGPNLNDPAPLDATGVYIDMHSYGRLILWPWGFTSADSPNATGLQTLGRKWAYFNGHTPQQANELYITDGASKDYSYGIFGVPGYTWEVGTAFFQDCSYFENTLLPANLPALIYAAKVVRTPYMTPAGPDALNLVVSPATVTLGDPATLTATVNDTRYNNSNGAEPVQNIAAAEVYVDTPPWLGGTATAMAAADGSFSSTIEGVTATLDTAGLTKGRHTLFVRGQDASGNWGAFSAIFVTVTDPDNQPPTADPQSVSTAEDTAVAITLTGSDPEYDPLTFSVTSGPTHGTLSGTAPSLTYTPDANYSGPDSFAFVVSDGQDASAPATVTITVTPVNDAPVANAQSVMAQQDTPLPITLTGSDVDGDALTYAVLTPPEHGTLSGTAPDLTYTPASGYTGADSFAFQANDGLLDSNIATVGITVHPPGPVTLFFDDFETDQGWIADPVGADTATTGVWEWANPEGTDSSGPKQLDIPVSGDYDLVTGPLAGSSVGDYDIDGGVTSIRSPDISLPTGAELELSFYYYLAHLNNSSADDYLRVTVVGSTTALIFEELGAATDDDADWASFSASLNDFAGQTVYLLIEAADAGGASLVEAAIDDVQIVATNPNEPPTADAQSVTTAEDTAVSITLTGSDPEEDPLSYSVTSGPSHGTLSGTAPDLTYTPDADWNGADSFQFVVNDGQANSPPATVSITVSPVNDPPVADPQSVATDEDTPLGITLTGSDVDGDSLTYVVVSGPAHGALGGSGAARTYTPTADWYGPDSFTFQVHDGLVDSAEATVSISVNAVNDAPLANGQSVVTQQDTALAITLTASDVDGDGLTYAVVTPPSHGALTGSAPNLTYTPSSGYTGSDSFTFQANDGHLDSNIATVGITVNPTGLVTVFFDDFESDLGWMTDPDGADTATAGLWEWGDPEATDSSGPKQLGDAVSGVNDLVTGRLAGPNAKRYDVDGGVTSIRSPAIALPSGTDLTLSFYYYLAHGSDSSADDYLRVQITGATTQTLFQELGSAENDDGAWAMANVSLNAFAGQTVHLLAEAADEGEDSLVEAALDDVAIMAESEPTAVELLYFQATGQASAIALSWETASEVNTLGFHLVRAEARQGARTRLNAEPIPAHNPGSLLGGRYEYLDAAVTGGVAYLYWLEIVDVHGATSEQGPVSAHAGPGYSLFLPRVTR